MISIKKLYTDIRPVQCLSDSSTALCVDRVDRQCLNRSSTEKFGFLVGFFSTSPSKRLKTNKYDQIQIKRYIIVEFQSFEVVKRKNCLMP